MRDLALLGSVVTLLYIVYGQELLWLLLPIGGAVWVWGIYCLARSHQRRGVMLFFIRR